MRISRPFLVAPKESIKLDVWRDQYGRPVGEHAAFLMSADFILTNTMEVLMTNFSVVFLQPRRFQLRI